MSYSYLNNMYLKRNTFSEWYASSYVEYKKFSMICILIYRELVHKKRLRLWLFIVSCKVSILKVKSKVIVNLSLTYEKNRRRVESAKTEQYVKTIIEPIIKKYGADVLNVSVQRADKPYSSALYIAQLVSNEMRGHISYKKISRIANSCISNNNSGCIIEINGRINGHSISRKDRVVVGKVSRNVFVNNLDYKKYLHVNKSGCVGIKVWVNSGEKLVKKVNL